MKQYEKYKASGVDWIGDIPEHWEVMKLKYLLKFDTGGTPSTTNMSYFNGDNVWLSIRDLGDKFVFESKNMITDEAIKIARMNIVKKGSLLYSFKLSIGIMAFAGCDLYTNEAIASFSIEKNKNLNFWYYVLPSFIEKNANENIYDAKLLNQFLMKNAFLINPPPLEQQKIASYLDKKSEAINQFIKNKQKLIELLEEEKKTLITQAVTKGINPNVSYKNSGVEWIGDIPEEWKVESFKNVLVERNKKNNPIESRERLSLSIDKGITLYSEKTTNLDRFKDDFSQYKLTQKGDLVFNSMNMIVGAVGVSNYFGCVSPIYYTYYTQLDNPKITKYYEYFFKSKIVQSKLYSLGKGLMAIDRGDGKFNTVRLKVSKDDLRSIKVPYPPILEITEIVDFIELKSKKIDELKTKYQQEIDLINEYKERLIYDTVTGKINVQETA